MENLKNDQVTNALIVLKNLADRCLKVGGIFNGFPEVAGVYQSISIIENRLNERTKRTRKTGTDNSGSTNFVPPGAVLAGNIKAKKEEKEKAGGKTGGSTSRSGARAIARVGKALTKKDVKQLEQLSMPVHENGKAD